MRSHLRVEDLKVEEAVEFYKTVFGAEVEQSFYKHEPPRLSRAELKIGSGFFSVYSGSKNPDVGKLILHTPDPNATLNTAIATSDLCQSKRRKIGGGWESINIQDPFGYTWTILADGFCYPKSVVERILQKSPIRSLMRYQLVSHEWHSIIFNKKFMREYEGEEMLVMRLMDEPSLVIPMSSLLSDEPMSNPKKFKFPPLPVAAQKVFANCGTLRCEEYEDSILLYNVATLEHRKLPLPTPRETGRVDMFNLSNHVYGVAHVDDDVKVVKLNRCRLMIGGLYSLRSDKWKDLFQGTADDRVGRRITILTSGAYSNGNVHWIMRFVPDGNLQILCVDMRNGNFSLIPLPQEVSMHIGWHTFVVEGVLYVCANLGSRVKVWEKLEDGWALDLDLDYSNYYPLRYGFVEPLYLRRESGDMVKFLRTSIDPGVLYLFDTNNHSLLRKAIGVSVIGMFTYTDSFVSPHRDGIYWRD